MLFPPSKHQLAETSATTIVKLFIMLAYIGVPFLILLVVEATK